jgi:hypothetical protein
MMRFERVARAAGIDVETTWNDGDRWFSRLVRR